MATLSVGGNTVFDGATLQSGVTGSPALNLSNATFPAGHVLQTVHSRSTQTSISHTNGNTYKGELCKLPMYDFKGEIVRGKNKDIPNKPNPWTGIKKK